MLEISAKSLKYSVGAFSLNIENFCAIRGKVNLIIGPNGAGKSTFIKMLAGVLSANSGEIYIGENLQSAINPFERACIVSYLPQDNDVFANLTVYDLIGLGRIPLQNLGRTNEKIDDQKIHEIAERLNCKHLLSRNYATLSGGEKRICRLAMALISAPQILLIDEPFNHLDIKHQADFIAVLAQNAQMGLTIIAIIHDLNIAFNWGDNFTIMKNGEILAHNIKPENLDVELLNNAYEMEIKMHQADGLKFVSIN